MRLAAAIHIIARDVGRNRSLLKHLSLTSSIYLPTASMGLDIGGIPSVALAKWTVDREGQRHKPLCAIPSYEFVLTDWVRIDDWLSEPILFAPGLGTLTRAQIVASVRDQDGGAHFDFRLSNEAYEAFAHDPSKLRFTAPGYFEGAVDASVRQITHELLGGLRRLSDCLGLNLPIE